MLLTLSVSCLKPLLIAQQGAKPRLALTDIPAFAREKLGLHGVNLSTDLLAGVQPKDLEHFRDRADRAGCPCLLLVEHDPQPCGDPAAAVGAAVVERMDRVIRAARLLGCTSVAVKPAGPDTEHAFELAAQRLKQIMQKLDRTEMNLLISPTKGFAEKPEKVTELIKKIGGFRVGTYPDFAAAADSGDAVSYLRRLTPYAAVINAPTVGFTMPAGGGKPARAIAATPSAEVPAESPVPSKPSKSKVSKFKAAPPPPPPPTDEDSDDPDLAAEIAAAAPAVPPPPPPIHTGYDIPTLVAAILSVGYDGTVAVDYRGPGDVTIGIQNTKAALDAALVAQVGEP